MYKKILSIVLIVVMMFTCVTYSSAAVVPEEETVQPMYQYIASHDVDLEISNGQATYSAYLKGTSNVTKINCKITLQKKGLLFWNDETVTASYTKNASSFSVTKIASVSSGKYRTKAVFTVYSGTSSEEITVYSSEVSC